VGLNEPICRKKVHSSKKLFYKLRLEVHFQHLKSTVSSSICNRLDKYISLGKVTFLNADYSVVFKKVESV